MYGCIAGLTALDVHADSSIVLTGAEDGSACLSNIQTGRLLGRLAGEDLAQWCWCVKYY